MGIATAIGLVFLFFFHWGLVPPNEKNEKNKANGNGNAHANFDWYFWALFFKIVWPNLAWPHLPFFKFTTSVSTAINTMNIL